MLQRMDLERRMIVLSWCLMSSSSLTIWKSGEREVILCQAETPYEFCFVAFGSLSSFPLHCTAGLPNSKLLFALGPSDYLLPRQEIIFASSGTNASKHPSSNFILSMGTILAIKSNVHSRAIE